MSRSETILIARQLEKQIHHSYRLGGYELLLRIPLKKRYIGDVLGTTEIRRTVLEFERTSGFKTGTNFVLDRIDNGRPCIPIYSGVLRKDKNDPKFAVDLDTVMDAAIELVSALGDAIDIQYKETG
jgi:hypothetical protein